MVFHMLQAFIVTLREGVEAALMVGITLAYLSKIGRPELRKSVFAALIAAFVGSIGIAILLSRTQWNQDIFEGWIMLAAAFFVVTMIIFMMQTGRALKGQIERKVGQLAGRNAAFGLFLFVFLMVLREGVETVLILGAVSLNSTELLSFLGTLLGVSIAVLFGVMFVKGSVRINLQKFFRVTTVILFFVAAQLTISGLHELSENGVLPSSREEMALIGPIVRNDLFFFVTIVALAALMVLFEVKRRQPSALPDSPAERRKALWSARRERLWMVSVYASSFLFILMVTAEFIYTKSVSALSPATEVTFTNGQLSIPLTRSPTAICIASKPRPRELRFASGCTKGQTAKWPRYSTHARFAVPWAFTKDRTEWFARTAPHPSTGNRWARPGDAIPFPCLPNRPPTLSLSGRRTSRPASVSSNNNPCSCVYCTNPSGGRSGESSWLVLPSCSESAWRRP